MTDLSREAVTAAVQIADLHHLLKHHALQALRDAQRQVRDAADTIGRLLEARSASMPERVAAIDALGLALTTLTLGLSTVAAQACTCTKNERDFLGGLSRGAGSGASPQEEKLAEAGTAPVPSFTFGAGNAAAGSDSRTAESVSEPPFATPTKPAGTSALSDEQMAAIEQGKTGERHLCAVLPLPTKRAFASGHLPPRGPKGAA